MTNEPHPIAPRTTNAQDGTTVFKWESKRERLDADWRAVRDQYKRVVHGYAVITETPAEIVGRVFRSEWGSTMTMSSLPFSVSIYATRDSRGFGAIPRATSHATREEAVAHARRALAQQGKRYTKKFGAQ